MLKKLRRIAAGVLVLAASAFCTSKLPIFSDGGPDAAEYGAAAHFPVGTPENFFEKKFMVGSFSHFGALFPSKEVPAAAHAWQFRRGDTSPDISYFHAGQRYAISDYLTHLPITGLLIAKDDQILFEAYQYARTDRDRFTSQSMAKTVVAMLMGVAVAEHAVKSVDDVAGAYVPELKDADYGRIKIRDLLHMSSGVSCGDAEEKFDAINLSVLKGCKQEAPAGTRFRYSAADSQVLGAILTRTVHAPLPQYLSDRIWAKIGTEASAMWAYNTDGQQIAYCCFDAVLRDYARLGRLLAFDGAWEGKQLIPRQWLLDATTISASGPQLAPGKSTLFFGYGYQTWIFPGERRMFGLLGANGQRIFVDPSSKLVMAQTAVTARAMDPPKDAEMIGLWLSLVHQFGKS